MILAICCFVFFISCKTNSKSNKVSKLDSEIEHINPSKVTVVNTDGKYQLMVDGKPFYIRPLYKRSRLRIWEYTGISKTSWKFI